MDWLFNSYSSIVMATPAEQLPDKRRLSLYPQISVILTTLKPVVFTRFWPDGGAFLHTAPSQPCFSYFLWSALVWSTCPLTPPPSRWVMVLSQLLRNTLFLGWTLAVSSRSDESIRFLLWTIRNQQSLKLEATQRPKGRECSDGGRSLRWSRNLI